MCFFVFCVDPSLIMMSIKGITERTLLHIRMESKNLPETPRLTDFQVNCYDVCSLDLVCGAEVPARVGREHAPSPPADHEAVAASLVERDKELRIPHLTSRSALGWCDSDNDPNFAACACSFHHFHSLCPPSTCPAGWWPWLMPSWGATCDIRLLVYGVLGSF
jgi:hypothetical protein